MAEYIDLKITRDSPVTDLAKTIAGDKAINEVAWGNLLKLTLEDFPEHLRTVGGLVDYRKDAEKFFNLQKGFGKTTIPGIFTYIERLGIEPGTTTTVEAASITREYGAQALSGALIQARIHSRNPSMKIIYGTLASKLKNDGLPDTPACKNAGTIADDPVAAIADLMQFGWQKKQVLNLLTFMARDGLEVNPAYNEPSAETAAPRTRSRATSLQQARIR